MKVVSPQNLIIMRQKVGAETSQEAQPSGERVGPPGRVGPSVFFLLDGLSWKCQPMEEGKERRERRRGTGRDGSGETEREGGKGGKQ